MLRWVGSEVKDSCTSLGGWLDSLERRQELVFCGTAMQLGGAGRSLLCLALG